MWSTSLIGWYVEWSTNFLLNLSSLRMVPMMITELMNILVMASFDGFQPESPLNIEPIMV